MLLLFPMYKHRFQYDIVFHVDILVEERNLMIKNNQNRKRKFFLPAYPGTNPSGNSRVT